MKIIFPNDSMPKRQADHARDGDEPAAQRSRCRIFSPSNMRASGSMTMGVMAMMAVTMPVGVVSSAHCMQLTPIVWPARLLASTHGQSFEFFAREKMNPSSAHHPARLRGMPPFDNQENEAEHNRAADDALVAGRAGIGMFAGRMRDDSRLCGSEPRRTRRRSRRWRWPECPGHRRPGAIFKWSPGAIAMATPARMTAMQRISARFQFCAEPEPFNHRGARRDEALGEENRPAAAEPRQGLKIRRVAEADAGETAQNKNGKRSPEVPAPKVFAQIARKKKRRRCARNWPRAAQPHGGAMAANGGDGKQQRGEQCGEHVGCGWEFFGAANPVW